MRTSVARLGAVTHAIPAPRRSRDKPVDRRADRRLRRWAMRILLTSVLNPWEAGHGGGQLSTHNLAVALSGLGHHVTVAYSARDLSAVPVDLPYETETVAHTERIYFAPLKWALRLARRGDRRWDIAHSQGFEGAFLSLVLRRACPLVATSRHPDPPDLRGIPSRWRPMARCRWNWDHISPLLARRALMQADHVVCVSRHSESVLRARGYVRSGTPTTVIHNGASLLGVEAASSRARVLVCVARLDAHKGIDVLLRALASLGADALPLEIYGEGPEESALRTLARSLGVSDRVTFRGHVPPRLALARIAEAETLVLPSRAENFPRVILEAMALETPIVATHVGGICEAVESERHALLVVPDDPLPLARALTRMSSSEELRRRLATNARERSRDFTWEESASALERLYEGLTRSPSPVRSSRT